VIGALRSIANALRPRRARPAVLMYHRIAEADCDPWGLAVSPAHFDAQLGALKREREVISLATFGALLAQRRLPARAVAITFDDGYACNALVAAPILRAHALPATFFLATGAIGGAGEFWWDDLARLVVHTQAVARRTVAAGSRQFDIDFAAPPVPPETLKAWTWSATPPPHRRLQLYLDLWSALRGLPHADQQAVLAALREAAGAPAQARATHRAMTAEEVRSLDADALFSLAPHTVTHPALGELPEPQQRREIADSREACAALARSPAPHFAYPYGHMGPATTRIVREAGFALAVSTAARSVAPGCDPFAIPRLQVLDRPAAWLMQELGRLP
jgi:peptidoglycan/xylan/chitin deacetylase (PgdA/CDA1 family)